MPTPSFGTSPAELVARFEAVAARHSELRPRKMFGYPALFVDGNYATGLYEDRWVVRLSEADAAEAVALPGGGAFSPMPGRTMKGWAMLPPDVVADDDALDAWLARAVAFAGSLPPKG
jgi:hypothetical protein